MNTDWTKLVADLERLLKLRSSEDLVGAQCRAVVGLGLAKDHKWRSGEHMVGVWYSTQEDAAAHQAAMECVPDGRYEALAVAPLAGGRLDPPDIALFYATQVR